MRRDLLIGAISSMGLLAILGASSSGIPSAVWSTKGNRGSSPPSDFLGTTDDQPLLIQTEGRPAITIGSQNSTEFHRTTVFHQNSSFETNVSIAGSTTTGSLQAAHLTAETFDASNVRVSGTTTTGVLEITGGDVAEPFKCAGPAAPGSVVVIDPTHPGQLSLSGKPYDRRVAGIVSGAGGISAGLILYHQPDTANHKHVALTGRVFALADDSNGKIAPGDLLTTSGRRGHAMKVTDFDRAQGAIIGKAMTALDAEQGLVLVLVSLQ